MNALEVVLGVSGVLFTGGVGWWARYVTSGASKAHKLGDMVTDMRRSMEEHERREEGKFEEARKETAAVRDAVSAVAISVGELHGKMDALSEMLGGGGGGRRGGG